MNKKSMVEKFQCPGCVSGSNTKCGSFKLEEPYGFHCSGHVPGTTFMPGGRIFLGLPKGFDKLDFKTRSSSTGS